MNNQEVLEAWRRYRQVFLRQDVSVRQYKKMRDTFCVQCAERSGRPVGEIRAIVQHKWKTKEDT